MPLARALSRNPNCLLGDSRGTHPLLLGVNGFRRPPRYIPALFPPWLLEGSNAMQAITNTVEAVLWVAVLILAPLVLLAFWNHITTGLSW